MRLATILISAGSAVACVALAAHAHAADVTIAYGRVFGGAIQANGSPIDRSEFSMDLTVDSGLVTWGADMKATQNGRAGLASDIFELHAGHTFGSRLSVTPSLVFGYERGLNADAGVAGGVVKAAWAWSPKLSTEASAGWRHSFGTNAFALNSADLPHTTWHQTALTGAQVIHFTPHFAVGLEGEKDFGTVPDTIARVFSRFTF